MDIHKIEEILGNFDAKAESAWKDTAENGMDSATQKRIFSAIEKKTKGKSKNYGLLHFATWFCGISEFRFIYYVQH